MAQKIAVPVHFEVTANDHSEFGRDQLKQIVNEAIEQHVLVLREVRNVDRDVDYAAPFIQFNSSLGIVNVSVVQEEIEWRQSDET